MLHRRVATTPLVDIKTKKIRKARQRRHRESSYMFFNRTDVVRFFFKLQITLNLK